MYVIKTDKDVSTAELRTIKLGPSEGNETIVESGLEGRVGDEEVQHQKCNRSSLMDSRYRSG